MQYLKRILRIILQKLGLLKSPEKMSIQDWDAHVTRVIKHPLKMILPYIKDDSMFIDVGANVGAFTEAVLKARKNITAHLFEPVPEYYQWITNKFKNSPNVVINSIALSDSKGQFQLWVDSVNKGWNTMIREKTSTQMKEISIDTIEFDEYVVLKNIQEIGVIKIDVEGAEFKVLKGMQKTLSRMVHKPVIICEIGWGKNSHPNWEDGVAIFEWMFINGYKRFDYNNILKTKDVMFIPK